MKIARIQQWDGAIVWAALQGNVLFRLDGDPMQRWCDITNELVEPKKWLPPVDVKAIMCIGRNYAAHAAEGGAPPPEYPILFMKNLPAATGHEQTVHIPKVCEDEVDYEGELVVIIGKTTRDVSKEQALNHVLGYTIGLDVSARIWQEKKGGSQWCRAKSFDTFAPLGPVFVTADEIPNPQDLGLRTFVNKQQVQDGHTGNMIFDVATLVSFLSQDTTLIPGTVIMTGTPEGVGWARNPKLTLKPGDTVTVEIDHIGRLVNTIA